MAGRAAEADATYLLGHEVVALELDKAAKGGKDELADKGQLGEAGGERLLHGHADGRQEGNLVHHVRVGLGKERRNAAAHGNADDGEGALLAVLVLEELGRLQDLLHLADIVLAVVLGRRRPRRRRLAKGVEVKRHHAVPAEGRGGRR